MSPAIFFLTTYQDNSTPTCSEMFLDFLSVQLQKKFRLLEPPLQLSSTLPSVTSFFIDEILRELASVRAVISASKTVMNI